MRAAAACAGALALFLLTAPGAVALPDYDGDGATDGDCAPLDPAVHPAATDKPDLAFEDVNCDGIDGDAADAIFVATTGSEGSPGTRDAPMLTINAGIAAAAATGRDVYVAGGTYDTENVTLADAVGIYGAFVPGTWARSRSETTTIEGSPQGALADGDQGVVLQLLTLRGTPDGDASAYGLRAISGSSLALAEVSVSAADATDRPAATSPATPPKLMNADGEPGACVTPGTMLGLGPSAMPSGGDGGTGGGGGGQAGQPGQPGVGNAPDSGGEGGLAGGFNAGSPGDPGSKPAAASDGFNAPFGTATAGATWTNAALAQSGASGATGIAGSGGGGGGGHSITILGMTTHFQGGGGGEGGGGGPGGPGGTAGQNGGGSFGVYLFDSTVVASSSALTGGNGGDGGDGGSGATGGPGGDGGAGGMCGTQPNTGGDGGDGGEGGDGGDGGGGSGGPSAGVFATGAGSGYALDDSTASNSALGLGGRRGGSGPRAADGLSVPILLTASAPLQSSADFDGDGVGDVADSCPATSRGTSMNSNGCPDRPASLPDADGDLIPDSADSCPGEPRGDDPDEDGCPGTAPGSGNPGGTGDGTGTGTGTGTGNPTPRVQVRLSLVPASTGRQTVLRRLRLRVSTGSRVSVRCRGRGCPRRRYVRRPASGRIALGPFVGAPLRAGLVLEIRVTKPGHEGVVKRVTMRRGKRPRVTTLCLAPGARTPARCAPL